MEVLSYKKFKKQLLKKKDVMSHDETRKLGISMATSGDVEELLKNPLEDLKVALLSLCDATVNAALDAEKICDLHSAVASLHKVAGPRRMW